MVVHSLALMMMYKKQQLPVYPEQLAIIPALYH